ncbi:MAG: DNA-methyltransferase [Polyangiales bacterium]
MSDPPISPSGTRVIEGDNLVAMHALMGELRGKVALAYMDPPFGTGRDFGAYDDRWETREALVSMLRPRFEAVHALLRDDGSILVHLDHRVAHAVAIVLDELFGTGDRDPPESPSRPGFRNEIIWTYGLGGSSSRFYPRKHDVIFWYTKGSEWIFDPPKMPARSIRMKGKEKKQIDVFVGPPRVDEESDVWDVASINNMAKERTGYPTQKPMALLERLVLAHSRPGDIVLDPFCGSGTTLVAAHKTQRIAVGIDASPEAVRVSRGRLSL